MSAVAAAVIGSAIIGGVVASKSASKAAKAQTQAADLGVAEQRDAREEMRGLLQPFVDVGSPALTAQMNLAGLGSEESQRQAIAQQEQNPLFQSLARQGEQGILQNASATGGLRGGNVQGALGQFRPHLLSQFIEQQYSRLGGLAQMGQNSAAGVGAAGMSSASSIADLFRQSGNAQANASLASGAAWQQGLGMIGGFAASPAGGKVLGKIF